MKSARLLPDQLNTWSDNYAQYNAPTVFVRSAQAAKAAPAPTAPTRSLAPWLPHRTLQTVRQGGMQMRSRSRSWPEVLPLRKSSGTQPTNGLRPAGFSATGHGISLSLPSASPNRRANLRDQWRTPAPARSLVEDDNGRTESTYLCARFRRYAHGGHPSCEYACRVAEAGARYTGGPQ